MSKQPDGIWIIDAEALTSYANDRMAEILGTSVAEMIGQPSFVFVFSHDLEAAKRLFDFKRRGDLKPFRFHLRGKDGSPVSVHVQGTPLYNAAGVFRGIVGTFTELESPTRDV